MINISLLCKYQSTHKTFQVNNAKITNNTRLHKRMSRTPKDNLDLGYLDSHKQQWV